MLIFLYQMHTLVSVSIPIIVFSWSVFASYIVFHPFAFNLFIPLYLECFSCRQNIAVSYFLIQSDRPCFSSTMFKCLIFNAIIYNLGIIPTIVMVFFSIYFISSLFFFTSFPVLLWVSWIYLLSHLIYSNGILFFHNI